METAQLIESFNQAGQGHVFRFWNELSAAEQAQLAAQAAEIDLAEIARLNDTLVRSNTGAAVDLTDLEPAPYVPLPANGGDAAEWAEARRIGEDALRAGRVAAFVVAGGQGTRLGYDGRRARSRSRRFCRNPSSKSSPRRSSPPAAATGSRCTGSS
jgi:UDP-N-acetylglucosamine/UDP-N-acetylgalactosamine diphosphorylase